MWKKMFLALVVLTQVKGTSVRKKTETKAIPRTPAATWGVPFFIKNRYTIDSSSKKRLPKNMEFDAKGVPKWNRSRCQKSSKINAKTGNEKD